MESSTEISGKGLQHSYQQASSLIGQQTTQDKHVLNYKTISLESDYECICTMIIGKTRSVPLNTMSSVF